MCSSHKAILEYFLNAVVIWNQNENKFENRRIFPYLVEIVSGSSFYNLKALPFISFLINSGFMYNQLLEILHRTYAFIYRTKTGQFDDLLGTWKDKLKKTEPNIMTLKIQKEIDTYKVLIVLLNSIVFCLIYSMNKYDFYFLNLLTLLNQVPLVNWPWRVMC